MTDEEILKEAQERLKICEEDDGDNRKSALEDLKFVAIDAEQWPADIKAERISNGQPCLVINKLPTFIAQVVGDQRMNRPSIKVVPVDNKADINTARVLGGWIKHVQHISKSDVAVDHGFEHAVTCGYGAMRVVTKYASDTGFEQEAYIEKVANALSIYWGPHNEYDCSDAMYCFIVSDIDRSEYKRLYKKEPISYQKTDSQYVEGWSTKDTVRVVEYYKKENTTKKIYLLEDERILDEKPTDGTKIVNTRTVKSFKIMWYLLSGDSVLDNKEWIGRKYIPVIPIWGKEINVGGKRIITSLIRNGKDAQRMYNYWQSCDTEVVALQPKIPYILTPKQVSGHETQWRQANRKSYPYLLVEPDPQAPGWPQRQSPPQASTAMVEKIQQADQEMRDTMGLQKASLGMQSNERSGAAIRERKLEGDVGTFVFIDNLSRSIEHLGRVLVDIAPRLLDTNRIIRLGLEDGSYEFAEINKKLGTDKILNDLRVGTYDAVVTVGPSFTTQRVEARTSLKEFIQYYPQAAPFIGDLYAKAMDWPGAEEVSKRLEYLLPPEVKRNLEEKRAKEEGKELEPVPQQQPNPIDVINLEIEKAKLEEAKIELSKAQEELKALIIENEMKARASRDQIKSMVDEMLREAFSVNKSVEGDK